MMNQNVNFAKRHHLQQQHLQIILPVVLVVLAVLVLPALPAPIHVLSNVSPLSYAKCKARRRFGVKFALARGVLNGFAWAI